MLLCLLLENPYTYEWSFVSAPTGHPGVIDGKHKKTVKVSEVRDQVVKYWVIIITH